MVRTIGVLLILAGIAFLYADADGQIRLVVFGSRAKGTIVRLEHDPINRRRRADTPIVSYMTRDSQTVEFRGFSQFGYAYEVGQRVSLLYLPDRPRFAEIDSFPTLYLGLLLGLALGCGSIAGGVAILRKTRRRG